MRVQDIMSKPAFTCGTTDTLNTAAQQMWEHDCGAIPVVGPDGKVVGIVTDRDICMAAYMQGQPLTAISVANVMTKQVSSCRPEDDVGQVEKILGGKQIRRVPVVDVDGRPIGILSLNDIARTAVRPDARKQGLPSERVVQTLAAICGPRGRQSNAAKA